MPDSTLPRWARALGRTLRAAGGVFGVVAGVGAAVASASITTGPALVYTAAVVCVVAGVAATTAVLLHRWRWEMVASSFLALAVTAIAGVVWSSLTEWSRIAVAAGWTRTAALGLTSALAAVLSIAALFFLLRTIDLLVFAAKTAESVRLLRRWDAE